METVMRLERDLLGEKEINDTAYYGINTQRALENFLITGRPIHPELVKAIVTVKKAAAVTNEYVGLLDKKVTKAIVAACDEILSDALTEQGHQQI
jgi:aspartate ammonia-lyase